MTYDLPEGLAGSSADHIVATDVEQMLARIVGLLSAALAHADGTTTATDSSDSTKDERRADDSASAPFEDPTTELGRLIPDGADRTDMIDAFLQKFGALGRRTIPWSKLAIEAADPAMQTALLTALGLHFAGAPTEPSPLLVRNLRNDSTARRMGAILGIEGLRHPAMARFLLSASEDEPAGYLSSLEHRVAVLLQGYESASR